MFLMVVNKKREGGREVILYWKMRSKKRRIIVLGNPYFAAYDIIIDSGQRSSMAMRILWYHCVK